jgi:general secretion pathway protein D
LSQPVFDSAQYRTELTAKEGQTLVMGGIIQKTFNDTSYKTPILGSIPGLNYIFGKRDKNGNRTELLVFLRPKVVRTPQQAKEMYDEVTKKLPLVEKTEQ